MTLHGKIKVDNPPPHPHFSSFKISPVYKIPK